MCVCVCRGRRKTVYLQDTLQMPKQTPLASSLCRHPANQPVPLSLGSDEIGYSVKKSNSQHTPPTMAVTNGMLSIKAETNAETQRMRMIPTRF